ncbi:phage tail protein [Citromicrobium bathyomarinum]
MSKVIQTIVGVGLAVAGAITGNWSLILAGVSMVGGALLTPSFKGGDRTAAAATLQIGEIYREAIAGRVAVSGSLVDAFNFGGEYGTDWEVLVIALADHRCDALEGFFVDDTYHTFTGDGPVPGFNGQLEIYWRDGRWDQEVPQILLDHGPGWTANDRGRSVAYVVVAYKADDQADEDAEAIFPAGRPRFRFVPRGMRCYSARLDSSVGGSGPHRRDDPSTWEWTENVIDCRYNWARGIYAGDKVDQPEMLLVGRGLSAIEAPPQNVFARANICDELVGGAPRYRIGALISGGETHLSVEEEIAAACAGVIIQPQGAVEIDPGAAKAPVAHFTDADMVVGTKRTWSDILSRGDDGWVNTVVATFVDPAQRWIERSTPPARVQADLIADGGPREQRLRLPMVPYYAQATRVTEIVRRLGRLFGRAQVTLPPRFAAIEEGDWVTWQSDRYFGGATKTFRVDAWGSDEGWRHQLTLREIDANAFADTATPEDTAVGVQQPSPGDLLAPGDTTWTLAGIAIEGPGGSTPALRITGAIDSSAASLIRVDYREFGETEWNSHGDFSRETTALLISPVADQTQYEVSIRYIVDGFPTPRRVLGPVTSGTLSANVGGYDGATIDDILGRLSTLEGAA